MLSRPPRNSAGIFGIKGGLVSDILVRHCLVKFYQFSAQKFFSEVKATVWFCFLPCAVSCRRVLSMFSCFVQRVISRLLDGGMN